MAGEEYDFTDETKLTNKKLAAEIANLAPPDMAKIQATLPTREDRERFQKLIEIVNGAQSQNEKLTALVENIGKLSGAAVTILKGFLKIG